MNGSTPESRQGSKLILVGYCTGEILARYLIAHDGELFQDKKVSLLLMASPSLRSKLAARGDFPAKFYKTGTCYCVRTGMAS